MGSMLFAVLAVAAQLDRNYVREKTLEGQGTAAAKGNHGGRRRLRVTGRWRLGSS
jgi:hypothetical protein